MRKPIGTPLLGALFMLAITSFTIAIDSYPQTAAAQTAGMVRREDRRATRREARETKHACNASGTTTRAECRHEKHRVKETGRENRW
jgi:hypothetical protein